jgi:hypothetical protein
MKMFSPFLISIAMLVHDFAQKFFFYPLPCEILNMGTNLQVILCLMVKVLINFMEKQGLYHIKKAAPVHARLPELIRDRFRAYLAQDRRLTRLRSI